jgi:uncharacterized protein YgiM (DUF1202 family)
MKRIIFFASLVVLSIGIGHVVTAQNSSEAACAALIQASFESFAESCIGKEATTACYGYRDASVTFVEGISDAPDFALAGDTLDLAQVQTITSSAFDLENETWGLAALNVQANVPLAYTSSEPGLSVLMFGDVTLENQVSAEQAFVPNEGVTATALLAANVRSGPSTDSPVLVSLGIGTEAIADALTSNNTWLRVTTADNQVGWVSTQLMGAPDGGYVSLPSYDTISRTPMQSFILKTGTAMADCTSGAAESIAVPPLLVIQGPNNMPALVEVNGEEIAISSTIALRILADNTLQLITLSGDARVGGVFVPAGFTVNAPLSEDGTALEGLWSSLRPINPDERAFLTTLQGLDPDLYHFYAFELPSDADLQAYLQAISGSGNVAATPVPPRSDIISGPVVPVGDGGAGGTPAPTVVLASNTPAATFQPGTQTP